MPFRNTDAGTAGSAPRLQAGSNLKTRILSALVLVPIALVAVWIGGFAFAALVAVGAAASTFEWSRFAVPDCGAKFGAILAVLVLAALLCFMEFGTTIGLAALAVGAALTAIAARLWAFDRPLLLGVGAIYVGVGALALLWLRDQPNDGLSLLVYVLLVVWATDTGAYAAGITIGGPKLAPRISPKKTWAGLGGGVFAAALAGGLVALVANAGSFWIAATAGAVLAVVAQTGDLFESFMKRRVGLKDSGALIPGHGGVLDRIDGLLTAAPVFALTQGVLSWW